MNNYFWPDVPSDSAFPLASAGYPFIFASVFATAVFALLGLVALSLMGLAATFFICFFLVPEAVYPFLFFLFRLLWQQLRLQPEPDLFHFFLLSRQAN